MTVIARDDVTLALVTDVASTSHYFQLQASTASAPTAPTVYPAPSPWVTTEPAYTDGATNSLYTVDVTVFSDGSFDYTPVSLSSSYEAAKAAYNKAKQAQSAATNAAQSATSAQTTANLALANAQELVVNGGFETGDLTGWTASGVAVLSGFDQDYPHSGNYQARFAAGASCSQSINGLVSGHIIRCSFWQRGFDNRTATMTISFNGGTEQTVGSITGVMPYTRAFKDFTVPANTTTATIKLTCDTNYIRFDDISVKDITEAAAAQSAADAAQTTADGKNTIRSSQSQPSAATTVPGDLWFQLDSSNHVTGIQVWNGSAYVDYVLVAQQVLVAGSVGTISLSNGAVTADKVTASEALLDKLLVRKIVADDIDVGNLAAAVIQSGMFKTGSSGARVTMDSTGIKAYDANGNVTFQVDSATGKATMVGGMATALSGKRISISQSGDTGKVALLNDGSELSSLTFIDNTNSSGYVYTGLYTGQNAQFIQFATLVDNVNHQPDPKVYDASITARGKMLLDASNAINVNGTWFARDQASLPTAPQVVGGQGTKAFADGIEYTFDGSGAWVSQTHTWDDAMCVAVPTASSSTVNGTTSARMDTMTGDSDAYTRGSNYIQVAHAGTYLVSGAVQVAGVSGGSHHVNVAIGVDGYSSSNRYMSKEVGGGPGLDGAWITAVYPAVPIALTAGQRVYLIVACDVAGAVIQPNGCLLSITRIGD